MLRPKRLFFSALLSAGVSLAVAQAGICDPPRYQILGKAVDPGGRPVADATVRLLLDRISAEEFQKHGPRARLRRTNSSGIYVGLLDCGAGDVVTDAPNPCAKNPKHLTVMVEAQGHRMRLVTFKLKELEINKDAAGCLVQVSDIRLSR